MTKIKIFSLTATLLLITACGGGGGGGGTTAQPTAATLKLSITGTLPVGTSIAGVDVTVSLPSGVTARSTTAPVTDSGVVIASGVAGSNASVMGTYAPASGGAFATVRVLIADANGFETGEFATVYCDIASGSSAQASNFTVQAAEVKDLNGAVIEGMTTAVQATID